MGKGNYPLAGHHMRDESMLFGPIMKVKKRRQDLSNGS